MLVSAVKISTSIGIKSISKAEEEPRYTGITVLEKPQKQQMPKSINDIPMNVDFIISKQDIHETLQKLLEHCIEVEEYERCAEIVKLQNVPPKKKRGRPKKTITK